MATAAFAKRQRSASAESASSSNSNKRAISNLASMDISDNSGASSSSSTEPLLSSSEDVSDTSQAARQTPPEGQAQLEMIESLVKASPKAGYTWFVVSRRWYRRWQTACGSDEIDKDKDLQGVSVASLGPIDNADLSDKRTGKLTKKVQEGVDVVFVPSEAWYFLEAWYGRTGAPVSCEVALAKDGTYFDLYPPVIYVSRVVPPNSPNPPSQAKHIQTASSWTINKLKEAIAEALDLDKATPSRIWHLSDDYADGTIASDKLEGLSLDTAEEESTIRESTISEAARLGFEQANADGSWLVQQPQEAAPAPGVHRAPFGGASFLDQKESLQKRAVLTQAQPLPLAPSKATEPASSGMRTTRSQSGANNGKRGLVGLQNLGNTCFMNSALQCLSNTPSLQDYFYSGFYKQELNPDNPLGMNGEVARAFGTLIERIWSGSGTVVPREFKQTLSKFAPAFSGWQQHDSQELIAFLLDGLHEDLNRIKKKPYDEIPDWEGGGDKEEMELANTSWELYKKRNDSVIVDLFQGQYRSRLICPECSKVAIKFDPFMYLSLAIPQNKKWTGDVYLVPADSKLAQKKITLELPLNHTIKQLKEAAGNLSGYDPKKLFMIEEFSSKFFKVWPDSEGVSGIRDADIMVLFELPYTIEQPRFRNSKQKTLEEEGKFMVSVTSNRSSSSTSYAKERLFGEAFVLALTKEEASSVETIERKICERLESWQGVGSDVWDSDASNGEAPASSKPISAARAIIPDDEEDKQTDTEMAEPTGNSAAPIASTPARSPNRSLLKFYVAKSPLSGYRSEPFIGDMPIDRITLAERAEAVQSRGSQSSSVMPGSFGIDETEDLYGDGTQAQAQSDGVNTDMQTAEPVSEPEAEPILRAGETITVDWNNKAIESYFGNEVDRKRTDNTDKFSTIERIVDPVVQKTKKAGNVRSEKKGISIESLLDEFVKEEKLSEDNTWYCPACKKHQQAQKKFDLWKMPDVLVIHLKRFSNERAFRDKIDTLVDFPIEGLDLSDRVEGKKVARRLVEMGAPAEITQQVEGGDSLVYDLFAVDNHFGGLGGGHYTAYAKNNNDQKWYNFDDSRVSPVRDAEEVKTQAAYLLFYCRRSEKPIGGKTHEILASQTASPALSAIDLEGSTSSLRDQSFRINLGGGAEGSSSGSNLSSFTPSGYSSSSGHFNVIPQSGISEHDLDTDLSRPDTGNAPSPNVSDDGLGSQYNSYDPAGTDYGMQLVSSQWHPPNRLSHRTSFDYSHRPSSLSSPSTGWDFATGSSYGYPSELPMTYPASDIAMESAMGSAFTVPSSTPPVTEIRLDYGEGALNSPVHDKPL